MDLPVRNSVRVLLLNPHNELLLICADDPTTTSADKTYHGRFWYCIGGQIDPGETLQNAALREIHEETGISHKEVELGPVVWFGEFDMIVNGIMTHLKQTFLVAKTTHQNPFLNNPDNWEKNFVEKIAWFSLENIKKCPEPIFPVVLADYLPDILSGVYPKPPIEIDLAKQPDKKSKK